MARLKSSRSFQCAAICLAARSNSLMSWPMKLRAMSFAVTMGVTLTESVMGAIPIGLALWFFSGMSAVRILELLAVVVATVSLSISIYSHVRPTPLLQNQKRDAA